MTESKELITLRAEALKGGDETKESNNMLRRELVLRCSGLHASYLFSAGDLHALKEICSVLSSTPPSNFHLPSWKDLAALLGISFHQMQVSINIYTYYSISIYYNTV